jgi:8-oxo-dGTP pyrophosphatase MutT (NUDIX family)
MAPAYRADELRDRSPPPAPKEAAVLILFYPYNDEIFLPLTRRTDTLESHKGQVSLPGGAREWGESLQSTALRETCEELNACPGNWQILGRLSPLYIPPSGFLVSPFVAYSPARPEFEPDPVEVAELIETPIAVLRDPGTVTREKWMLHGAPVDVPYYRICGHKVWGATAMVLSELIAVIGEVAS